MSVLYKTQLHDRVHVVHKYVDAYHKRGSQELYIANHKLLCTCHSRFISLGESLPDDIIRFATMGDIVLIGDFNAQTKDEQKLC